MSIDRRHDPILRGSILARLRQDPSEWRRHGLTPPDELARIVAEHLNTPPLASCDNGGNVPDPNERYTDTDAVYSDFFTGPTPTM